jgi:hypothetical protein
MILPAASPAAAAIRQVPAGAWQPGIAQDGGIEEDKDVAEITHLMSRAGNRPDRLRWIARRVKPSRRHLRDLTGRPGPARSEPVRTRAPRVPSAATARTANRHHA